MPLILFALLAAVALGGRAVDGSIPTSREQWAVKLAGDDGKRDLDALAGGLAAKFGLSNAGRVDPFDGVFLFELPAEGKVKGRVKRAEKIHTLLSEHPDVVWSSWQRPLKRVKRSFEDEFFNKQWHLVNRLEAGHDINVTSSWAHNITGRGVVVAVIDDGLEHSNLDLRDNYNAEGSYDFNGRDSDPVPRLDGPSDNSHGTKCGGLIAAVPNHLCGVGVAYESQVAGIRILDGTVTDLLEGKAFTHQSHINSIYSCSWGPDDSGKVVEGPGPLALEGLTLGTTRGRYGYGNIYVFASGNGGRSHDNCNFDGYANSIRTLTVGAVEEQNKMPYYAESCSAILAVTYSNGRIHGDRSIVTTALTKNGGCTDSFSGTSAAAPIAAGIVALMLQVRPCLTWRDVQSLLVYTSVKVDTANTWVQNGAGHHHSNQHGFGLMDTYRLTTVAAVWPLLPNLTEWSSAHQIIKPLPPSRETSAIVNVPVSSEVPVTLEYVGVTVTLKFPCRGALEISLTSPRGTKSILATKRIRDDSADGLSDWTLTSAAFWGEEPQGAWSLSAATDISLIKSCVGRRYHGNSLDWKLLLYGSALTSHDVIERKRIVNDIVLGSCDLATGSCDWSPDPCPPRPSNPPQLHVSAPFILNTWQLVVVVVIQGLLLYALLMLLWECVCKVYQRRKRGGVAAASSRGDQENSDQETAPLLAADEDCADLADTGGRSDVIEMEFLRPSSNDQLNLGAALPVTMETSREQELLIQVEDLESLTVVETSTALQELSGEVVVANELGEAPVIVAANKQGGVALNRS